MPVALLRVRAVARKATPRWPPHSFAVLAMTSVPAPSAVATVVQLLAIVVALSCITLHRSSHEKQIRLEEDETPPSQEEIDVARMAKEMDGVAVKRDEFAQHVRFSRTLLVLLSSLTIATSVAEIGFVAAYANRPWTWVVQEQMAWPVLSGALLWVSGEEVVEHTWQPCLIASVPTPSPPSSTLPFTPWREKVTGSS